MRETWPEAQGRREPQKLKTQEGPSPAAPGRSPAPPGSQRSCPAWISDSGLQSWDRMDLGGFKPPTPPRVVIYCSSPRTLVTKASYVPPLKWDILGEPARRVWFPNRSGRNSGSYFGQILLIRPSSHARDHVGGKEPVCLRTAWLLTSHGGWSWGSCFSSSLRPHGVSTRCRVRCGLQSPLWIPGSLLLPWQSTQEQG